MKKKKDHRVYFDQQVRAQKIKAALDVGFTFKEAVKRWGGGANRISCWRWLKLYTNHYQDSANGK